MGIDKGDNTKLHTFIRDVGLIGIRHGKRMFLTHVKFTISKLLVR